MNTKSKDWLSRKEAAAHLAGLGYPITPKTLSTLAARGKGPPYRRMLHRLTAYSRIELEQWARANTVERMPAQRRGALNSVSMAKGA